MYECVCVIGVSVWLSHKESKLNASATTNRENFSIYLHKSVRKSGGERGGGRRGSEAACN